MIDKAISLTYKKLVNNTPDCLGPLRKAWESDVGLLEEDDWREALQSPREIAVWARFRLIQLPILHRSYASCSAQYHMGHCTSDQCMRACGERETFFHILWECPKIQAYWRQIAQVMAAVVGEHVPLEARWHILGVTGETVWPK